MPQALLQQLAPGGRMILPLRERGRGRAAAGAGRARSRAATRETRARSGALRSARRLERHDERADRIAGSAWCALRRGRLRRRTRRRRWIDRPPAPAAQPRPPVAQPTPVPARPGPGYYVVKRGDTLYSHRARARRGLPRARAVEQASTTRPGSASARNCASRRPGGTLRGAGRRRARSGRDRGPAARSSPPNRRPRRRAAPRPA